MAYRRHTYSRMFQQRKGDILGDILKIGATFTVGDVGDENGLKIFVHTRLPMFRGLDSSE